MRYDMAMDVAKIAKLSKLQISKKEENYFNAQFKETLKIVDGLNDLKTNNTKLSYTVTGTKNVFREDTINVENILNQEEALLNSKKVHNGYIVVDAVLQND